MEKFLVEKFQHGNVCHLSQLLKYCHFFIAKLLRCLDVTHTHLTMIFPGSEQQLMFPLRRKLASCTQDWCFGKPSSTNICCIKWTCWEMLYCWWSLSQTQIDL